MTRPALPNLIVIGAMKCGTTSLNDYLALHPQIHMAAAKEINFFSGENAHQSLDWYMNQFDAAYPVRGEASQNYSKAHYPLYRGAPERMAELVPDAKLIYLVRDPIERHRSHMVENYVGETAASLVEIANSDHVFQVGRYAFQLRNFLKYFPIDQILVIDSDDLLLHRRATMNRIFVFLGLDPLSDPQVFDFMSNRNETNGIPARWQRSLPFRIVRKLAPFDLERLLLRPTISKRLFPGLEKPKLSSDDIARLQELYAAEVADLRAITGQSFSGWQV